MIDLDILILISHKKEVPSEFKSLGICTVSIQSLQANDFRKFSLKYPVLCIITGVGHRATLNALTYILKYINSKLILNLGSSGSSNPNYINQAVCPIELTFNQQIAYSLGCFPFLIKSTPIHIIKTCESVTSISIHKHTDCIDMEAYWQAEFCNRHNIPFVCLKFVTDNNDSHLRQTYHKNLSRMNHNFNTIFSEIFKHTLNKISIIIPTHNRHSMLERSIHSVLNQTYTTECIVIDDGSSDATYSLLKKYKKNIHYIKLSKNMGVSYARNYGIKIASGDWIGFLDSDDEWKSNKIENQVRFLKSFPYFQIIQSEEEWIRSGEKINKKKYHQKQSGFIWNYCLDRCMISPSSVLINRNIFDFFGCFDEVLKTCEDYDFWLRLSRYLLVGLEPSVSLIKYGGHNDQLSNKFIAMDRFRIYALKKALNKETHPKFKLMLTNKLYSLTKILEKGARKRGNLLGYFSENRLSI